MIFLNTGYDNIQYQIKDEGCAQNRFLHLVRSVCKSHHQYLKDTSKDKIAFHEQFA